MYDPDSTTFVQRVTLCCLVNMAEFDQGPADAAEIRAAAKDLLETANGQPVGSVSEADVVRALNGLSETELVDEKRPSDQSPVGKGRPKYVLEADIDRLRETLETDDDIAPLLR